MAQFTRGRASGATQMGGEGAQWVGASLFSAEPHRFQNMGDGTLAHSGILAVRQAVAAGTDVTFKILVNGVVAMTGGQEAAGALSVPALSRQLEAEGVVRIDVVTNDPKQYGRRAGFAPGVKVHDRRDLDAVQRELRAVRGVTALLYDQACAADLRRERKRGRAPTPTARVMINEAVCEGCGDCGAVSNCLSVHPVDTPFGRKTRIHQDSCNLDTSCVDGNCPAFVTVTPSRRRVARRDRGGPTPTVPPEPARPAGTALLVAGIGGTGVVTVGQVLSTAANLDGLDVSSVDQTGMAQKGGPVVSHLRIGAPAHEGAARLEEGRADGYLVFDLLTGVAPANLARLDPTRTRAVVSTARVPTGAMVADVGAEFPDLDVLRERLDACTREAVAFDAEAVALSRFGSQPAANLVVVGVAYQLGLLPPSAASIERAIELNGVAVETNVAAFRLGRAIAVDPSLAEVMDATAPPEPTPEVRDLCRRVDADPALGTVLAWRVPELVAYQDRAYAARYVDVIARVRRAEVAAGSADSAFSCTVARQLYHLMAYKDEYEVARLHRDPRFRAAVEAEFGEGASVTYLLQPPSATRMGLRRKIRVRDAAARPLFGALRRSARLRGTAFDPFGRSGERRTERRLVDEYVELVDALLPYLGTGDHHAAVQIADLVDAVRGFAAVKERNLERYRRALAAAAAELSPPLVLPRSTP
jgi:indolepyruvate ferredoxin oxidoreductase